MFSLEHRLVVAASILFVIVMTFAFYAQGEYGSILMMAVAMSAIVSVEMHIRDFFKSTSWVFPVIDLSSSPGEILLHLDNETGFSAYDVSLELPFDFEAAPGASRVDGRTVIFNQVAAGRRHTTKLEISDPAGLEISDLVKAQSRKLRLRFYDNTTRLRVHRVAFAFWYVSPSKMKVVP